MIDPIIAASIANVMAMFLRRGSFGGRRFMRDNEPTLNGRPAPAPATLANQRDRSDGRLHCNMGYPAAGGLPISLDDGSRLIRSKTASINPEITHASS